MATLSFAGTADMDWQLKGANAKTEYAADHALVGMDVTPDRKDGPFQTLPVLVTPDYDVVHETIRLPQGGKGFFIDGDPIDQTIAGIHYSRTAAIHGDTFTMTTTTRNPIGEISYAAAKAADKQTDVMFAKALAVRMPYDYQYDDAELAALGKTAGDDAKAGAADSAIDVAIRTEQGQLRDGHIDAAIKTLDAAIKKDSSSARLYVERALLFWMRDDGEKADADIDAALAIDPHNIGALFARADRLREQGRLGDASIVADRLVLLYPGDAAVYEQRAAIRAAMGKTDAALADLAIVSRMQPDNGHAEVSRVRILTRANRYNDALEAAEKFADKFPRNATAQAVKGDALALLARSDEAKAALAKSIAIEPSADAYATRLNFELSDGAAGALADMLALIKLQPDRGVSGASLTSALAAPGGYDKLMAAYDAALKKNPKQHDGIQLARSAVNAAAGKDDLALSQYDAVAKKYSDNAASLNSRCWYRATLGIDLTAAAKECDAAIAKDDTPSFRDSRGLVDYRRGDYKQAIVDYDAALKGAPDMATSLYGRGLAKLAMGDKAGGSADIASARKNRKSIDQRFSGFGITPAPGAPAKAKDIASASNTSPSK